MGGIRFVGIKRTGHELRSREENRPVAGVLGGRRSEVANQGVEAKAVAAVAVPNTAKLEGFAATELPALQLPKSSPLSSASPRSTVTSKTAEAPRLNAGSEFRPFDPDGQLERVTMLLFKNHSAGPERYKQLEASFRGEPTSNLLYTEELRKAAADPGRAGLDTLIETLKDEDIPWYRRQESAILLGMRQTVNPDPSIAEALTRLYATLSVTAKDYAHALASYSGGSGDQGLAVAILTAARHLPVASAADLLYSGLRSPSGLVREYAKQILNESEGSPVASETKQRMKVDTGGEFRPFDPNGGLEERLRAYYRNDSGGSRRYKQLEARFRGEPVSNLLYTEELRKAAVDPGRDGLDALIETLKDENAPWYRRQEAAILLGMRQTRNPDPAIVEALTTVSTALSVTRKDDEHALAYFSGGAGDQGLAAAILTAARHLPAASAGGLLYSALRSPSAHVNAYANQVLDDMAE